MFYGVVSFMSITFSSCWCHLPLQSSSTCAAMLVHLPGADGKPRPLLNSFAQLVVAGRYHPVSISFNSFNIHQSLKIISIKYPRTAGMKHTINPHDETLLKRRMA